MGTDAERLSRLAEPKRAFWSGEIVDRLHAQKVMNITGWAFAGFGGLVLIAPLIRLFSGSQPDVLRLVGGPLLFVAPAVWLMTNRSRVAAFLLLGLSIVAVAMMLSAVAIIADGTKSFVRAMPGVLFWCIGAMMAWRAQEAAGAWRRERH